MQTASAAMFELAARLSTATARSDARAAVVGLLGAIVPARAFGIYELTHAGRATSITASPETPSWFLDAYEQLGRANDPVFLAVKRSRGPSYSGHILHWRQWQEQPVYELLDRAGMPRSLEAPVLVHSCLRGTINLARAKDDPPFSRADLCRLAKVESLVSGVYTRLADAEAAADTGELYLQALDAMAEPVVVSSRTGEVLLLNRAARRLTASDGLTVATHCQSVIQQNIRELIAARAESVRRTLEIAGVGVVSIRTSWLAAGDPSSAISYLYRRGRQAVAPPLDHSPLTARERELAALVSQGMTVKDIAREAFISVNTVKQHLKRIYDKLGVHSRAGLVQALWQTSLTTGQES